MLGYGFYMIFPVTIMSMDEVMESELCVYLMTNDLPQSAEPLGFSRDGRFLILRVIILLQNNISWFTVINRGLLDVNMSFFVADRVLFVFQIAIRLFLLVGFGVQEC